MTDNLHEQEPTRDLRGSGVSAPARAGRDLAGIALGGAALTTGLTAGVYFAYSTSVMPALHHVDDRTFVEVMQQINESIQNPLFFTGLFGALILSPVAAVLHRRTDERGSKGARWIWTAFGLYGAGFLVTIAINVPLNNQLADAGAVAHITDMAAVRHDFETPWVVWNAARALLSTAAAGCLARALVLHGRRTRR